MRVPRGLLTTYYLLLTTTYYLRLTPYSVGACAARPAYSLLLTPYYLLPTPDSLLFRCVCRAADAERVAALAIELATGGKRGTKGGKVL